jgi:hypothetical protein
MPVWPSRFKANGDTCRLINGNLRIRGLGLDRQNELEQGPIFAARPHRKLTAGLLINLKTAKALGITLPPRILKRT